MNYNIVPSCPANLNKLLAVNMTSMCIVFHLKLRESKSDEKHRSYISYGIFINPTSTIHYNCNTLVQIFATWSIYQKEIVQRRFFNFGDLPTGYFLMWTICLRKVFKVDFVTCIFQSGLSISGRFFNSLYPFMGANTIIC